MTCQLVLQASQVCSVNLSVGRRRSESSLHVTLGFSCLLTAFPSLLTKSEAKPIHFCWKIVTMVTSVWPVCPSPSHTPPFHPMSPWDLTSSWQCLSPLPPDL